MAAQGLGDIIDELKDKLGLGSSELSGLDIGSSSVKLIKLDQVKGGEYKVAAYAAVDLAEGIVGDDQIHDEDALVEAIKEVIRDAKISSKNICAGLAGSGAMARKLQLSEGSDEDVQDQVEWEAENYITFDVDKAAVSYDLISEDGAGGIEVMAGAANSDMVATYKDIIKAAGLSLKVLDLDMIALTNVFNHIYEDALEESEISWLLIDMGAHLTQFIVYRQGGIAFSKEIPIGSMAITEEIQRQMGVNFSEAEDLKITYDSNGNLPEEVLDIISSVAEVFFQELKKTLDFYFTSSSDDSIQNCYVTGGGCQTPGLIDGLSEVLEMEVSVLNPFDRIKIDDKKFGGDVVNEIAYTCVVAMGFAMRKIGE